MKGRILLLTAAVSSMILIVFLIPLAITARNTAVESALSQADANTQYLGGLATAVGPDALQIVVQNLNSQGQQVSVFLPDGTTLGDPVEPGAAVELAASGRSFTAQTVGGMEVFYAARNAQSEVTVVRSFVPDEALYRGVAQTWTLLAALAATLFILGLLIANWLARTLLKPVQELVAVSSEVASGNLEARVVPSGPAEIRELGDQQNRLTERVQELLSIERERIADLSHRLRTPLTSLRLEIDALADPASAERLIESSDALERAVDRTIRDARDRTANQSGGSSELTALLQARVNFWLPLAEDTGRVIELKHDGDAWVRVSAQDLEACLDALLQNFFAHTPDGSRLVLTVEQREERVDLVAADDGPGFPAGHTVGDRGVSASGSTGLGLDIIEKTARRSGGSLSLGASPFGGAQLTVAFGKP